MLKLNFIYCTFIALLAGIHTYSLLSFLTLNIPVYLLILILGFLSYLLYKKAFLNFSHLGSILNIFIFVLQLVLLFLYFSQQSFLVHLVTIFLFIGIEGIRFIAGRIIEKGKIDLLQLHEQYNQLNETFRVVREERHDFLKHVSSVHFMVENNQIEEAKNYFDDMVGSYKQTNLSIKGERGAVAGVLHSMYKRAQTHHIEIVYDFDLPLSTLPIADKEAVALIGNLLSNSIDSSIAWQQEHNMPTQVTIQFYKRSGLYILNCRNNTLPIPNHILDELYIAYGNTTKGKGHEGLGTKIIHDIVKEHLGLLDFTCKEGEFLVKIKIPAIR